MNLIKTEKYPNYVEPLAFSSVNYRDMALHIKDKLDKCEQILVRFFFFVENLLDIEMRGFRLNISMVA